MKSAAELAKDYWNRSQADKAFIPFIKSIQLDAQQGLREQGIIEGLEIALSMCQTSAFYWQQEIQYELTKRKKELL